MRHHMPIVIALALAASVATASTAVAGIDPTPVKTSNRQESMSSGNASYFAWTRSARNDPGSVDVWAEPTGLPAFQVSGRGDGLAGQIDPGGTMLPYQRITRAGSDLRLYDLATQQHVALPPGVNTRHWEQWPALYDGQMLFVRDGRRTETLFLVTDLATGDKVVLKRLDERRASFANVPHINGNWITWALCNRSGCHAYRYDIAQGLTEQVPNPLGLLYFAPAPDLAGNVYLERSRPRCGRAARMIKWSGVGDPTVFYAFPRGTDMTGAMAFDDGLGAVTLFVDFFDCSDGGRDIYSFTNP